MKLKTLLAASALAAAPILCTTSASYADIEYVVDATFDDSTSVTGYFILNVYGYPDNWDLTTTTGTTVTGYTYTPSMSLSGGTGCSHCVGFPRMNPSDYDGALQLEFTDPISGMDLKRSPSARVGRPGNPLIFPILTTHPILRSATSSAGR